MKCYFCGKEIDEGSIFCGYCGKEQPQKRYCIKCGQEIGSEDVFCRYCGASQDNEMNENEKSEPKLPPEPIVEDEVMSETSKYKSCNKPKKLAFGAILSIILFLVCFSVYELFFTESYEKVELTRVEQDGLYGYMDTNGDIVIPFQWKSAGDFSEGLAPVMNKDGWGYIDKNGDFVIQPQKWSYASVFSDGMASVVDENDMWGFVDHNGRVIQPQWNFVLPFSEGLAGVRTDDGWGYINKKGYLVISCNDIPDYYIITVGSFHDGLATVEYVNNNDDNDQRIVYINKSGKVVIDDNFFRASSFEDGFAIVNKGDYCNPDYYIIDKKGNYIIENKWAFIGGIHEGLAQIQDENDNWGFIDVNGNIIIPCEWKEASDFHEGLAAVKSNDGNMNYINKKGEVVIYTECKYMTNMGNFMNGVAWITDMENNRVCINSTGKIIRIENDKECECYKCCNEDCKEIGAILEPDARGDVYVCKYCYGRGMVQGGDPCLPH